MQNKKEKKKNTKIEKHKKNDRVQKELLKEVVGLIVGKHAEEVIGHMDGKRYINEFLIAKKLDITINQLRNILYKLSDEGIVSSLRKKDKRKGWYTYFWKIEFLRALEFLREVLEKRIAQLSHHIDSRERKNFYICEGCGVELSEENALLQNFICNECGEVFTIKDNTKLLRGLAKEIDRERRNLEIIKEEINNEKEILDKKRVREMKKEQKTKKKNLAKKKDSRKKPAKKKVLVKKKFIKKASKKKLTNRSMKKKSSIKKRNIKKAIKKKTKSKK